MRIKKALSLMLSLFLLLTTTGCWDSTDVNRKVLLTLILTDKDNDDYVFHCELPNLLKGGAQSGSSSGGASYSFIVGRGKTLADARLNLDEKLDNHLFLGTTRALVMTDSIVRGDLLLYMNRLESIIEYRKALRVAVTHDNPEDFLSTNLENNVSIGQSVSDTIITLESEKKLVSYSISEIMDFLYSKSCFVIPDIGRTEETVAVLGYVVIHDGKFLKRIPLEDSMGLLFILSDKGKWASTITLDSLTAGTVIELKKQKITPAYNNGKVEFTVDLTFKSKVEYTNQFNKPDEATAEKIQQKLTDFLQAEITKTIEASQNDGCDYLGFKNLFRIKFPEEVKQADWCALYKTAVFHITVNTTFEPDA